MLNFLRPDEYHSSIFEIDKIKLSQKGIKGIIIDLDNTLVPWNENHITQELHNWFDSFKSDNFKFCVVSNNTFSRGEPFAKEYKLPIVSSAKKPGKSSFKKAMKILGTGMDETTVVGDQLFTDVLGGKRIGLYTILVQPMSNNEFWGTKIVRKVEKFIINRW